MKLQHKLLSVLFACLSIQGMELDAQRQRCHNICDMTCGVAMLFASAGILSLSSDSFTRSAAVPLGVAGAVWTSETVLTIVHQRKAKLKTD